MTPSLLMLHLLLLSLRLHSRGDRDHFRAPVYTTKPQPERALLYERHLHHFLRRRLRGSNCSSGGGRISCRRRSDAEWHAPKARQR